MSKKIGLSLAFKGTNYGMLLQAYATQVLLEKLGFETEIIDFIGGARLPIWNLRSFLLRLDGLLARRRAIKAKVDEPSPSKQHIINFELRCSKGDDFRAQRLHNIVKISTLEELRRRSESYVAVLVGSDQLWGPHAAGSFFRTLRFATVGVVRISYSTSLGVDKYPWYAKKLAADFWNQIHFLSVREKQGAAIIKDASGRDAKVVLDPTYLLTAEEWNELIPVERTIPERYALCFFLGHNNAAKNAAKEYADSRGLKLVAIMSSEAVDDDSPFADEVLVGQSPEEFMNLVRFADAVFTDSFHGFAFSVINKREVFLYYRVRKGTRSRNSRIDNIVDLLQMQDRLIVDSTRSVIDFTPIDYEAVTRRIAELREDSMNFLTTALNASVRPIPRQKNLHHAELFEKDFECCGCEACVNICPKNVLEMKPDAEGFVYPVIAHESQCVGCRICVNVCPVKHASEISSRFRKAYAGYAIDETEIAKSASGGLATLIAKQAISRGGIVYGVAYDADFRGASYVRASSGAELQALRGSKYAQSRKRDVYKQISDDLKEREVLFIGTPCDVYAVKRYFPNAPRLTLVALICHGPTSPSVQSSFCDELEKEYGSKIVEFNLRGKKNGAWKPYYIQAKFENGKVFEKPFIETNYDPAFIFFKRPSCSICQFKSTRFAADLLIGDFHAAAPGAVEYHRSGVSSALSLTERGDAIMRELADVFKTFDVSIERSTSQAAVHSSIVSTIDRPEFARRLNECGLSAAISEPTLRNARRKAALKKKTRKMRAAVKNLVKRVLRKGRK